MSLPFQPFLDAFGVDVTFTPVPVAGVAQPGRLFQAVVNDRPQFLDRGSILAFPVDAGYGGTPRNEIVFRTADAPDAVRGASVTIAGKLYVIIEIMYETASTGYEGATTAALEPESL